MPQGGIDPGEDAEAAAIRELGEETGIHGGLVDIVARSREEYFYDLPADLVGTLWGGRYRGQRQRWFLMRFMGDDGDVDIGKEQARKSVVQGKSVSVREELGSLRLITKKKHNNRNKLHIKI